MLISTHDDAGQTATGTVVDVDDLEEPTIVVFGDLRDRLVTDVGKILESTLADLSREADLGFASEHSVL